MKRIFIYDNPENESSKYWIIDQKGENTFIEFGKARDEEWLIDFVNDNTGKHYNQKTYESKEDASKARERLITSKIKNGYIEANILELELIRNMGDLCWDYGDNTESFKNTMEEIRNLNEPLSIRYGFNDINRCLQQAILTLTPSGSDGSMEYMVKIMKSKLKCIADFIYELNKLFTGIKFNSFYSKGLQISAIIKDKELENYCKENLPKENIDSEQLLGVMTIAAAEENKDDVFKYLNQLIDYKDLPRNTVNEIVHILYSEIFKLYKKEALTKWSSRN
jgi:predicted DNA-binding WGR domain protein